MKADIFRLPDILITINNVKVKLLKDKNFYHLFILMLSMINFYRQFVSKSTIFNKIKFTAVSMLISS